jgi:predicted MFS family arabinose efflux permease
VILWAIPDGFRSVLVVSLAFAVLGVALLWLLVPDARPGPAARAVRQAFRWREVPDPRLVRLLLVAGGLGLLTVGDGFLYLAMLDRGEFAVAWFPLLYLGTNVAYLVLAVPCGRLADRIGRARVLVLGHLALAAAYGCVVVPVAGAATTLLPLALLGVFYAATDGVIAALAGRVVPPAVRATGIASAQTVVALARLLASVGFGFLWFLVGPQVALAAVGVALVAAVPVALTALTPLDARDGSRR